MNRQTTLVLYAVMLSAISAAAADISTTDGRTFRDAEIKAAERDGLRIVHRDGAAFLPFDTLPASLQGRYGWTPERAQQVAAEKAVEKARADEARRKAQEAAAAEQWRLKQKADEDAAEQQRAAKAERKRLASVAEAREAAKTAATVGTGLGVVLLIAFGAIIYFLPTIIGRRKQNVAAIFIFNLLFGWTFLGWGIAFVWAFTKDKEAITNNHYTVVNHGSPAPAQARAIRGRVVS